jgi:hypothetical protein
LNEKNSEISPDRVILLRQRVILAFKELYKVSDELLMNYDDDKGLNETAREISYFSTRIEDLEWENETTKG